MKEKERPWLKYVITLGAGAVISVGLLALFGAFSQPFSSLSERYTWLSNAFFVTGTMILSIGLLIWVGSQGTFDIFAYAFKMLFTVFKRKYERPEGFYEYKQRRAAGQKSECLYLILVGAFYILLAGLFTYLFLRLEG